MKPVDLKLLREAMASNGGGVNSDFYSTASRLRMMKAGLIQWKPNQQKSNHFASLLTITKAGKEALQASTDTASGRAQRTNNEGGSNASS